MSYLDEKEIQDIYENAMKDPTLFSSLNIDDLLEGIDEEKYNSLDGKTISSMTETIYNVLENEDISVDTQKTLCGKLVGYKYVDELTDLNNGRHIRWINKKTKKISNGGILVNVKFLDNGVHLLCLNSARKFNQIKFDANHIFQRLSPEEQVILMAYEYIEYSKVQESII